MKTFWPWLRLLLVTALLLAAVWFGIKEGFGGFAGAQTPGQRTAAMFQILYGVAALVSLAALFLRRAWLRPALAVWLLSVTTTGTMAPVVWGGTGLASGLLAGVVTAVVATLVCWGALAHARAKATTMG